MTNAFTYTIFFIRLMIFEMSLLNILILMKNTNKMFNMLPNKYVEVNCSN